MALRPVAISSSNHSFPSFDLQQAGKEAHREEPASNTPLALRVVEWVRAPNQPAYIKAFRYTTVALLVLVLALSICGYQTAADIVEAHQRQEEASNLEQLDQPVLDLIGGRSAYESLPSLSLNERDISQLSCRLTPQDMSSSIMKGTDRYNRPVLCFKIFDRTNKTCFVETIYRRYSRQTSDNPWIKTPSAKSIFGGTLVIQGHALDKLRQVLQAQDGRYSLAR